MDSLKLVHPFTLILAGPSGSGKSQFVKKLIENKMIKPFPKNIIWCYGVYQALYEEMPNISFHEGIPSNLHQYSDALIVIDDLMGELGNDPQLTKNRRDQSQITHLGRQLYPRKVNFFQECYADATSKPYGYLLIDLKPETDESLRVRTGFNGRRKKTILYLQVLQKYTHFSNENRRESEPVPNAASLSENQETESLKENLKETVVKTEKEVFEDEIFRIVPPRYKEKAKNIFQFLKLQESFSWNSDGEIIYKNTVIPGSNTAFLVNDFLRYRKSAPEGRYVFLRALNDVNLPKNLDVNKKLYQNNKIIKKPIMYARRNAWLKL
ncbi:uncharacterized protein TNCV_3849601 [Trichonephila clavipes]|nr:uncharacterized protein TNCV_3849601 [Trichonephila clavipes]